MHRGHLKVAEEVLHNRLAEVGKIWFVPSPQNPFKQKEQLIAIEHRLNMLRLVVKKESKFSVCDLELHLPKPNYTFVTLKKLTELHPEENFKIIIGEDNLLSFFKWKKSEWIQANFPILVYPRLKKTPMQNTLAQNTPEQNTPKQNTPRQNTLAERKIKEASRYENITFIPGEILEVSASEIRRKMLLMKDRSATQAKQDLERYLHSSTVDYLKEKPMPMKQANQAILKSVAAFTIWGLFPLYYALLSEVSSFIVVIARIISAFVLMLFVIALLGKQKLFLGLFKDKRKWQRVLLAGILIGVNWFIFIYAVAIDEVLETSLGYYISPLLSIFLGIFFLKEEVNQKQKIAIALLVLAILYKIYVFEGLPWISLSLALSFSLYGLVKKNLQWGYFGEL